MIEYSLSRIAEIVGGTLNEHADPAAIVTGSVEFDSRKLQTGSLFVCLPGTKADGHDFAEAAIEAGAVAVLAARDVAVPAIMVPEAQVTKTNASFFDLDPAGDGIRVLTALSRLARAVHDELTQAGMITVGVTGSAGKTSTKDMIGTVLRAAVGPDAPAAAVIAPAGSFNNEIGLPYTALTCTAETQYFVAEMAARGEGHIRQLTDITPPNVGVVLNVGHAHVGEFGSVEAIARAKGELAEAVPAHGLVLLNADDANVAAMAERIHAPLRFTSAGQSTGPTADVWASEITVDSLSRASFVLHCSTGSAPVKLQVFGRHQVDNAVAAAAVGLYAGMPLDAVAAALGSHQAKSVHRMEVTVRRDKVTVIDDSYNANPESMQAALAALQATQPQQQGGRRWAVLGQMGELGDDTIEAHERLGAQLAAYGIDELVAVGQGVAAKALVRGATNAGMSVEQAQSAGAAANIVDCSLAPGDVVLIKASNADHLWDVATMLIDRDRQRRVR
ncbi:UDP-N-acetylmuramoyl-tripeptide--D-alanyl-D-alanine ligase [Corynebacterium choanae]|uniref:UDP-N-acetylmuramoyl-tripeptide--D-alanyl-D-alanine ligase n=1 Tax=Corynebacterium choanae TaxID=1862358 RepID=A0A3G6J817_9CORY|nr:UDP-N-acetylmuramoyl-tripeptide--D-alanyl-D-alanine ligase [Corynebacterium choanae]AZA13952.1 UDP-N-acetylmuramoyl-tripeptide--D-alanyl-D-alanine ligase [Corynebacterium choanae]